MSPSISEEDAVYEIAEVAHRAQKERDQAVRVVRILYDLANEVLENAELNTIAGTAHSYYELDVEVRNELADFVADFHDDNPALWNLLTDEQKRRSGA